MLDRAEGHLCSHLEIRPAVPSRTNMLRTPLVSSPCQTRMTSGHLWPMPLVISRGLNAARYLWASLDEPPHAGGRFSPRSSALRTARDSSWSLQNAWLNSWRTARSRRPLRATRHVSINCERRPGDPESKASSKNVNLASGAVKAGTLGLKPVRASTVAHCCEETNTHFHWPNWSAPYLSKRGFNFNTSCLHVSSVTLPSHSNLCRALWGWDGGRGRGRGTEGIVNNAGMSACVCQITVSPSCDWA